MLKGHLQQYVNKYRYVLLVGKNRLKNHYTKSFKELSSCCGECWCCRRKRAIVDEFEKKGFETFNSNVNCWKVYNFLNLF